MNKIMLVERLLSDALRHKGTPICVTHQSQHMIEYEIFDIQTRSYLGYAVLFNDTTTERVIVALDFQDSNTLSFGVPNAYDSSAIKELIEEKLDVQH